MASKAPIEILAQICMYLPARDLKRLRHVSRSFNVAARSELFYEIHTYCDLESLRKISQIARTQSLRHLVAELHVHGLMLDTKNFSTWRIEARNQMLALYTNRGDVERFWDYLAPVDLDWHYSQFKNQVESENRVWAGDRIFIWLAEACKSFSRLEKVAYCPNKYEQVAPCKAIFQYESLDERIQRTLLQPGTFRDYHSSSRLFAALLRATTENPGRLRTIDWYGITHDTFDNPASILGLSKSRMNTIRHLKLGFFGNRYSSQPNTNGQGGLAEWLADAMMLRTLHLSFTKSTSVTSITSLQDLLTYRQIWPSLSNLRLAGLVSSSEGLIEFLGNQAPILRRLEIADYTLSSTAVERRNNAETHSWSFVIKWLASFLRLQHIKLDGELRGCVDAWKVTEHVKAGMSSPIDNDMRHLAPSLRDQVHEYILRGGQFPLDSWESHVRLDGSWRAMSRDTHMYG